LYEFSAGHEVVFIELLKAAPVYRRRLGRSLVVKIQFRQREVVTNHFWAALAAQKWFEWTFVFLFSEKNKKTTSFCSSSGLQIYFFGHYNGCTIEP
jgi:hypothetical protein